MFSLHASRGLALLTLAVAVFLMVPASGSAASVFLNGVRIDAARNQEFKNCSVKIDAKGNILISAKGVRARGGQKMSDIAEPTNPGGPPTKRYFLVTEKAAPGMSQYDIDLFINAKWVRKLLDEEDHIYLELTKHLKQGDNKIRFIARKNFAAGRRSSSPNHYFRVVVGEGDSGGRNVMITRKLIDYKRTAFESKNFTNEFIVKVF